ncbi:ABC transporter permease [Camelimonas abortus]|uniref:ABC transporter permease n=1 Tax=Camelimonas abortus TaxID=1017184 RepID=A0ABV7LFJ5_9HYPH
MSRSRRLSDMLALGAGLAFLYAPIVILVLWSFNSSRLVTVWGGFSLRWYAALFRNGPLMEAAWTSIRIAFVSATLATILGAMAALTLVRRGPFLGRTLFTGMAYAPMVMPEVMTGLALLLLFVGLGVDRGFWTVVIAHTTVAMCFATVVIRARLADFDQSLEEAAMDLGCPPWRTFFVITLPLVAPSLAAAFLLAFTISMDDLVIASFVSGPGSTTLPMRIYSQVRLGVTPEINAACTVLIALVAAGLGGAFLLGRRGRTRDA